MGVVIELSEAEMPRCLPPPEFSVPFASPSLRWGRKKRLRCFNPAAAAIRLSPSPSPDRCCAPLHLGEPFSTWKPPPDLPPSDRSRASDLLVRFPSPPKDGGEGASLPPLPVLPDLAPGEGRDEECRPVGGAVGWSLRSRDRGAGDEEKGRRKRRVELWVSLSREEIEEDFLWMTGAKPPPRRSRRRARAVSDHLKQGVFPGSWLPSKITANRYKVSEPADSRKG